MHQPLRRDPRHDVVARVHAPPAGVPQREGQALFQLGGGGGMQGALVLIGHRAAPVAQRHAAEAGPAPGARRTQGRSSMAGVAVILICMRPALACRASAGRNVSRTLHDFKADSLCLPDE